jgi:hypothetical protein
MKNRVAVILLMALLLISAERVRALDNPSAAATLDDLRLQLSDLDYKEADLKIRLEQLDSDLKPENIERYFNGYGSTRPEELREARRRQLQIEKNNLLAGLERISSERVRLTAAVADAQARAYHESAQTAAAMQTLQRQQFLTPNRKVIGISVLLVELGSLVLWIKMRRRRRLATPPKKSPRSL